MKRNEITTLYHYCSLETFLNIVKYKTIRFSDVNKSNDYLETKALVNLVKESTISLFSAIENYEHPLNSIENKLYITHCIDIIFEKILKYNDILTYVACFSEESDLLSQWCEYSDNSRGVAIGFNKNTLKKLCSNSAELLKIKKIHYITTKDNTYEKLIRDYSERFYNFILSYLLPNSSMCIFEKEAFDSFMLMSIIKCLLLDSVFVKNGSFEHEKEWRMYIKDDELIKAYDDWGSYYNWSKNDNENCSNKLIPNGLQFRSKGDDIVSYMDVSFENYIEDIINEIIIAPNCKLQTYDVYQIMHHFGFSSFKTEYVCKSKCPYRN